VILSGNRKFTADDVNDGNFVDKMMNSLDTGIDISMTPGLIDIPMCGWDEIKTNWQKPSKNNGNYPCNP
jgi:hypothetical protein